MIKLFDRIKERSYTIGTGNFALSGVFSGFSSFSSVYQNGEKFFYVANDGTNFEIGSGVYISANNQIQRFPIKSSNNNQKVNFPEGLKEVYVNYPATNSVFNGSGIDVLPVNSGLAFWTSSNSLSSENSFYVDSGNHRIGFNKSNPSTAIDIGGSLEYSKIRASGFIVGLSGIYFPSGNNNNASYTGGQQLIHYEMNQVDSYTGANALIELSGTVNQNILFKKQNAGTFLAGPVSGCSPACEPNYPVFRPISIEDLPALSNVYEILSDVPQSIRNDGRLIIGNDINSSGTVLKFQRFSYGVDRNTDLQNYELDGYKISLLNPTNNVLSLYDIPNNGLELDTSITFDSYRLYDIFVYYDNNLSSLKMSGVLWDNKLILSSGLLYDFQNNYNNIYTINFVSESYINSNYLSRTFGGVLSPLPFAYNQLTINGNMLSAGDTVLLTSQEDSVENGIYEVISYNANSGTFFRGPAGFYTGDILQSNSKFYIEDTNQIWHLDTGGNATIGQDQLVFSLLDNIYSNSIRTQQLYNYNNCFFLSSDKSKRYVGTIFTINDGLILDTYSNRHIFNVHNKILKPIKISKNNLSWNYGINSWRSIPPNYIPHGSVVYGLTDLDNTMLSLDGILNFASNNLQSNLYTMGISLNDDPLPPSGTNTISVIDRISVDYNDNISIKLKAKCSYIPSIGFNTFSLSEKGRSGNSITISLDDNTDSENHGGLFGIWYC